ncbi:D-cysteine desulfhydrase [Clostridium sediminicola]|uniref:1-aminocyclopropane-1-carboxylate deaminase/D-cysteine desulfhydrase n=1 Tax=Clostridium sediminicola TaxID=3114879 RepID=UPI0031F22F7B
MKMTPAEIEERFVDIPRKRLVYTPTPFNKLENMSNDYGVDIYMKREDLSGPSTFGGNKTRKLEFILGKALEERVDYLITYGAYQSNACMQMTTFCNSCDIKPILFLGDTKNKGIPENLTGNLLLSNILGAEIHYVSKPETEDPTDLNPLWIKVMDQANKKKEELEKQGYRVELVPVGCTHEYGWVAYTLLFTELLAQTKASGFEMDYIFHTNGSGGSLPAMIAANLMTDSKVKIVSVNVRSWEEGNLITKKTCLDRVKYVFDRLNVPCPSDEEIYAEMNIDENYIKPGYGIPNPDVQKSIKEVARREGMFVDPTYSGRGFHGMMEYIRKGIVPEGSKVVFIHTGGSGSFFSNPDLVKDLY